MGEKLHGTHDFRNPPDTVQNVIDRQGDFRFQIVEVQILYGRIDVMELFGHGVSGADRRGQ